jgi:hypothetical protein
MGIPTIAQYFIFPILSIFDFVSITEAAQTAKNDKFLIVL